MITTPRAEAASRIERARSVTLRSNNNRTSGGFPHSDISGSKPIPGSPKLNAGYHVLHRLLLPRHPPNALFALDLIQEEHDHFSVAGLPNRITGCPLILAILRETSYARGRLPEVNSMYFPAIRNLSARIG